MLVDSPLQIPNIHRLLSQPRGLIHQDPSNIPLHTWKIYGTHSAAEAFQSTLPHRPLDLSESLLWQSKWRIFSTWGITQQVNPLSATESVVSDVLLHLHTEKRLAISTIEGYQLAIASTLRATSDVEVGRNPSLKVLLQNIELEQGRCKRTFPEWNVALVLSASTKPPFEPLSKASDKLIMWKTVF